MTVPVYDYPAEVKAFVEHGLWGGRRKFGPSTAVGFANQADGLVAGFVYHDYDPDSGVIEISGYSDRRDWTNKDMVRAIFDYPFEQLGVRLLVARHSEKNTRVRRIWRALGAREYIIDDLWADGEAMAVAVLSRDAWNKTKLKRKSHGQA